MLLHVCCSQYPDWPLCYSLNSLRAPSCSVESSIRLSQVDESTYWHCGKAHSSACVQKVWGMADAAGVSVALGWRLCRAHERGLLIINKPDRG